MAKKINYEDDDLITNPFAFAAQAPVAPAMLAPVSAPVAAAQAPTAREMMNGLGRDGQVSPLSQTPGYGMAPVYEEPQGRGPEREGERGLLGYEFNPIAAGLTTVDVPKPPAILAEEKRIGKPMEATYATFTAPRGQGGESIAYGPPTGYRYDNGQSQYVKFDSSGKYYETEQRKGEYDDALKMAALFAAIATGGASLGLGEAGAGLLGAEGATAAFVPGEIAALNTGGGLTVGGAGAAGMGGGAGLTAALGTDLAAGGALTAGGAGAGAAGMGGAAGLTALSNIGASAGAPLTAAGLGLTSMGGGTGLTTAAAGGGTVGAGGVIPAGGTLVGSQGVISGGTGAGTVASSLPSWATVPNALLAANLVANVAKANETAPTAAPFTMAPYVPPSGKPFANLGMSPIATPYTPTRILGQYDPTMTPGGVSPYELIMAQMQAPKNLYADFEAGTNIGGYDPQRFVVPPAAAAAALPNNMGGMIDKSRMVGPNPMGPDNGFASIQDGEFVMNRKATQKYGIELMNAINSGKISKGKLSGLLEA